ncbi:hypothetical protein ACFVSW_26495 [Neobacillus sp. NPDC058068]|uniref:hypothetical protein n=1 Tax=Neobacillus sp. NPDC058068 TaxID=3346325 RepID=UPI0036DCBD24
MKNLSITCVNNAKLVDFLSTDRKVEAQSPLTAGAGQFSKSKILIFLIFIKGSGNSLGSSSKK